MKKILLAALAALTLVGTAQAQEMSWKSVPLSFVRAGNPATPFPGLSGSGFISGSLANGGKGGVGVAVSPQDTSQAIDIGDHYFRRAPALRAAAGGVAGSVSPGDTASTFGVLSIRSTSGTIDTVKVAKDVSLDGVAWTAIDSLSASVTSVSGTITVQPIVGDSCSVKLASVTTSIDGGTIGAGSILFHCNPFSTSAQGVSRLGMVDVRFVRFRIWMTPGDNVAAGSSGGLNATFSYPTGGKSYNN